MLDKRHDHNGPQHIAEQPHTQRQRPDEQFQHIDRGYDGNGLRKAFNPALDAFLAYSRCLHKHNAHNSQGCSHIQILSRRLKPKQPNHIGYPDVKHHCDQVWYVILPVLAQQSFEEVINKGYAAFQRRLLIVNLSDLQAMDQKQGCRHKDRHDDPCDHDRLKYGYAAKQRYGKHHIAVKLLHQ